MNTKADREKISSLDRPALQNYQLERLNQLLRDILPQNQFYARKLSDQKLPLKRISDLANIPFTTKQELVGDDLQGGCLIYTAPSPLDS